VKPCAGYYSLIQYCPNSARREVVNIGLVLLSPDQHYFKSRTMNGHKRIRRFFGDLDWGRISLMRRGVEHQIGNERPTTEQEFLKFTYGFVNLIRLTPPLPIRIATDPDNILEKLFAELVVEQPREGVPTLEVVKPELGKVLEEKIAQAGLGSVIVPDVNIPIRSLHRTFHAPFGYQNGRFNLVQPVPFRAKKLDKVIDTASPLAIAGDAMYEYPDERFGELQLIVVGDFQDSAFDARAVVREMLRKYHVRFFAGHEADDLIRDIRENAKKLDPLHG